MLPITRPFDLWRTRRPYPVPTCFTVGDAVATPLERRAGPSYRSETGLFDTGYPSMF